jgi:hypothetical protein
MRNLFKKWALVAAVFGVSLFQFGGCLGGNWRIISMWLQEDLFS